MSVGDADEQNSAVSLATGLHSLGGGPPRSISTSRVGECQRCRVAHLAVLLQESRSEARRRCVGNRLESHAVSWFLCRPAAAAAAEAQQEPDAAVGGCCAAAAGLRPRPGQPWWRRRAACHLSNCACARYTKKCMRPLMSWASIAGLSV